MMKRIRLEKIIAVLIILIGAFFRLNGLNWDQSLQLHPDERFLLSVAQKSPALTFNPYAEGASFYVYGSAPVVLLRAAEKFFPAVSPLLLGRVLSALCDTLTLILIYCIARRIWKERWAALFAAAAYAFFPLAIQQAHFFTADTFAILFCTLTWVFAILALENRSSSLRQMALIGASCVFCAMGAACKISSFIFLAFPVLSMILFIKRCNAIWRGGKFIGFAYLAGGVLGCLALTSLAFGAFQPYSFDFSGSGQWLFNRQWLANLTEIARQSGGLVDFPPAWQWANRPFSYAIQNLFLYGCGIPLSLGLIFGFALSLYHAAKRRDVVLSLMIVFVPFFAIWQMSQFSKMMRYFLPMLPILFVLSGAIFAQAPFSLKLARAKRWKFAKAIAVMLLCAEFFGAAAFSRIYREPHPWTRASEWIYANVPAPVTLTISAEKTETRQPLGNNFSMSHERDGKANLIFFSNLTPNDNLRTMEISSLSSESDAEVYAEVCSDERGVFCSCQTLSPAGVSKIAKTVSFVFPESCQLPMEMDKIYIKLITSANNPLTLSGFANLYVLRDGEPRYALSEPFSDRYDQKNPYKMSFAAAADGEMDKVEFFGARSLLVESLRVTATLRDLETDEKSVGNSLTLTSEFAPSRILFSSPLAVKKGHGYELIIAPEAPETNEGRFVLRNAVIAHESAWDDLLPLRMDSNFPPYDSGTGLYGAPLNLELYAPSDFLQREKLLAKISAADYFALSSNRTWNAARQAPKRFPLMDAFYRQLSACDAREDLFQCMNNHTPELSRESQGVTLSATFESEPQFAGIGWNTQNAEEAFTVYDHPKGMIYRKTADFDLEIFRRPFDSVDLSKVFTDAPLKYAAYLSAGKNKNDLMLTDAQKTIQRAGGTWAELFNRNSLVNANQWVAGLAWYGAFFLLGAMFYPTTRLIFGGLRDHGYGVSRFFGLMILGYAAYLCGFAGFPMDRRLILILVGAFFLVNSLLFLGFRKQIIAEAVKAKKEILVAEAVFLACFVFFLLIRLGNPDLWHPYKGGEKPMDFSYFNAVLKSSILPPYDPWFAGGTLNYYYYGFFLAGIMTKLLGIVPSIAYNLILPIWYAFLGIAVYAIGSNAYAAIQKQRTKSGVSLKHSAGAGVLALIFVQVMGNLGTLRIVRDELIQLGAAGAAIDGADLFRKFGWFFSGIAKLFAGQRFSLYRGDWYWLPSRAFHNETITEFPFFTFLYGDPHAHLFALPITAMVLLWLLSLILVQTSKKPCRNMRAGFSLSLGALMISSLIPTNTWDMPTYFILSLLVVIALSLRTPFFSLSKHGEDGRNWRGKIISLSIALFILIGASVIFFLPYLTTNSRDSQLKLWTGDRSQFLSYWMHWGFIYFCVISWYILEFADWMRKSSYANFRRFILRWKLLIQIGAMLALAMLVFLLVQKISIAWTAVPIMCMSLLLMLRPNNGWCKNFILFLIGTGTFITLFVEEFCLAGDYGRMNIVFKFYNQAWILLSLCAALSLCFALDHLQRGGLNRRASWWRAGLVLLMVGTLSYPITAGIDKITDRMSAKAPHTLDGMDYMKTSEYFAGNAMMDLSRDYDAIRWMQEHIQGSPVIVEANDIEYRWGNRFTIYTGLPGVVGWNYHQRQQRGPISEQVWARVNGIKDFYNSQDEKTVREFLEKYDVKYIIAGQLEKALYEPSGLAKFEQWDGKMWDCLYNQHGTAIYQVKPRDGGDDDA